jgi:subtilisin family serine protease/subtilisin-like proprotein convertase family protein
MGFPDRPRRARLDCVRLEDRTVPAALDAGPSIALPELAATGAFAGDRVNVVMTAETTTATDTAALARTPFARSVLPLGFGIYSVTLTPGTDLTQAIEYYGRVSGVQSAAADTTITVQQTPNDPRYGSLYGMTKIGAPTAWDTTTGNPNFVVAVIDSGVDYTHPDLAANMWRNPGEIPNDGIDNDNDGFVDDVFGADFANNDGNPMDDNNHGTHVAGTIGAVGNNAVGVAGVNWNVKIMALKFLDASGSGSTSNAVRAIDFAVTKGVKLSNNSWGGGGADPTLTAAIGRARTAGHIFVAAAGNSGQNIDATPSYPASYTANYDNVVAVAATDSNDVLANFSNYGATRVQLAAPGVSIVSTTPNNTYSTFSGTSMAAPHVTGAIALYWGQNPSLTYQQVISKLTSSVDPVAGLAGKVSTGGRLNVAKMLAGSTSPPVSPPPVVPPVSPPPFVSGPKVTSAVFNGTSTQLTSVRVTFDKAINATTFTAADVASFTGPNGAITTTYTVTPVSGTSNQFDITFAAQTAAGNYSLTFGPDIRDTAGNQMNQNGNTANGETADRFTAGGTLTLNVNRTYDSGAVSVNLADLTTTTITFTIAESLRISDMDVALTILHTYDSDLSITLTSPTVNGVAGRTVTLFNRRGGAGDNLSGTRFDDEAAASIATGAAPFAGSFRPETALSAFDGLNTAGAWTLRVTDNAAGDVGRLTNLKFIVAGVQGAGGLSVTALGFRDEAPAAAEPTSAPAATAHAADATADDHLPFADEVEPTAAAAVVAAPPADPLLLLFGTEPTRTADLPPLTPNTVAPLAARAALPASDIDTPEDPVYAMLEFASAPAARSEDVFEAWPAE